MDLYSLHLAMAALVGASVVAVSAYYMHRKTLNQLLEFAKTIERERERDDLVEDGGVGGDSPPHSKRYAGVEKRRSHSRRKGSGYYRRGSASLPDVTAISSAMTDVVSEEKRNVPVRVDSIPAGLPRLHALPEGMYALFRMNGNNLFDVSSECMHISFLLRISVVIYRAKLT